MSVSGLYRRAEVREIPLIVTALTDGGLPQHLIEQSISRHLGAKLQSIAVEAERTHGHALPRTPFDAVKGDSLLN